MLKIDNTRQYRKDLKKYQHQKLFIKDLRLLLDRVAKRIPLEPRHRDHSLTGDWINHRECHVKNDILLIYRISECDEVLYLERLGSHSELFG